VRLCIGVSWSPQGSTPATIPGLWLVTVLRGGENLQGEEWNQGRHVMRDHVGFLHCWLNA
jgi:hypothetical protein